MTVVVVVVLFVHFARLFARLTCLALISIIFSHFHVVLVIGVINGGWALLWLKVRHAECIRWHFHLIVFGKFTNFSCTNLIRGEISHLAGMQTDVLLKDENVGELLVTHGALVEGTHWWLDSVDTHVCLEVALGGEGSAADLASVKEWNFCFRFFCL